MLSKVMDFIGQANMAYADKKFDDALLMYQQGLDNKEQFTKADIVKFANLTLELKSIKDSLSLLNAHRWTFESKLDFLLLKQNILWNAGEFKKLEDLLEKIIEIEGFPPYIVKRLRKVYKLNKNKSKFKNLQAFYQASETQIIEKVWKVSQGISDDTLDLENIDLDSNKQIEAYFNKNTKLEIVKLFESNYQTFEDQYGIKKQDLEKNIDFTFEFDSKRRAKSRIKKAVRFQNKAIKRGRIRLFCPFTKRVLKRSTSFYSPSGNVPIFYKFNSTKTFYLLTGDVWQEKIGIYVPDEERIYLFSPAAGNFKRNIAKLKTFEVKAHLLEKKSKKRKVKKRKCIVIKNTHFAHHIWNELSALQRIVKNNLHERIDKVFVLNQSVIDIEKAFPELASKIKVINKRKEVFDIVLKKRGFYTFPIGDCVIQKPLVYRIIKAARITVGDEKLNQIEQFSEKCSFVVWISYRADARTLVDINDWLFNLIMELKNQYGEQIGFIFDGYSLPNNFARLNKKKSVIKKSIGAELKQIDPLLEKLDNENIQYENLIGKDINEVISWTSAANFYIAHHGSLQHKIAWFANIPGIIHCNSEIYNDEPEDRPGNWERENQPKPIYLQKEDIKDSDEPVLYKGNWTESSNYKNYNIDISKIITLFNNSVENYQFMNNTMQKGWGETQVVSNQSFGSIRYLKILKEIHNTFDDQNYTYLEIGTNRGNSVKHSKGKTICIDPNFRVDCNIINDKKQLFLFQETSDDFFDNIAKGFIKPKSIDYSFIDGLHHATQVIKDFYYVEKYCHADSIIVLHDVLPRTYETSLAERKTVMWTGDVWKTAKVLMELRPDYEYITLNAPPSGLLIIKPKPGAKKSRTSLKKALTAVENTKDSDLPDFLKTLDVIDSKAFLGKIGKIRESSVAEHFAAEPLKLV